jgi:hypothetical protein
MSQEEFDKEFVELKERLGIVMKLLQERQEDHRYGWVPRKRKVKWYMLHVKLKHMLRAWLRKELRGYEFR